ncbi:MBOAT family protein [Patulibacter sp. NPDC049589]|uniref:MBOAT family O-acyltransferase n=1 Tax=Patulibacter sp. NPDC049589 TaxID=3154731 RepID=UPI00343E8525
MVFPSVEFALFFPIVFGLSWLLMERPSIWKPFVLTASYVFYSFADPKFCILLAAVTLGNQAGATLIDRADDERVRKRLLTAVVALDLAVLGVFKYYGFFVGDVDDLLSGIGLGLPLPLLTVALPIGLSFLTFQAISYVVDVKRGSCERASIIDFALYLSFFPHLVAGPIVRAREFLPQLATPRRRDQIAVGPAVVLICIGLVKKVILADLLARQVVDPVFAVPEAYGTPDVLLAAYAYAAQIYCDFSGYTDIAIGLALLMGIMFPQNFDSPYRSRSMQEFWRRWHMTLSRYLRDFLYVPLGGNRGAPWKTYRNLFLTMLLGGLWHGAAWGFVLWGAIHGAALVIERLLRGKVRMPGWLAWLITFHVVVFALVPFRAPELDIAWSFFERLFSWESATLWSSSSVFAVVLVIGVQLLPEHPMQRARAWVERLRPVPLGAMLAVVIATVGAAIPAGAVPTFIYFAF